MVDQQHGVALIDQVAQLGPEPLGLGLVQPGGGLVEQQDLRRLRHQRPSDAHQLALALGQLAREPLGDVAQVEQVQHLVHPLGALAGPEVVEQRRPQRQPAAGHVEVGADRDVVEQLQRLPGAGQPVVGQAVGRAPEDLVALQQHRALRVVGQEPGDRVDERGLARAVGPDEPGEPAAAALQRHVVHRHQAAESHGETRRRQHHFGCRLARHRPPRVPPHRDRGERSPPSPA